MPITQLEIRRRDFEAKAAIANQNAERLERMAADDEAAGRIQAAADMRRIVAVERSTAEKYSRLADPETSSRMHRDALSRAA